MREWIQRVQSSDVTKLFYFIFVLCGTFIMLLSSPQIMPSVLLSGIFYFLFAPLLQSAERRGFSRGLALLLLFGALCMALVLALTGIIPRILTEWDRFSQDGAKYLSLFQQKLEVIEERLRLRIPLPANRHLSSEVVKGIQNSWSQILIWIPKVASQIFVTSFLTPLLTFFLLQQGQDLRKGVLSLVPNRYFELFYSLFHRIFDEMGGYVSARLIEAALITIMVSGCFFVAGVPYGFLLGLFVGATNPIPYLGPLLGAAPGLILALLDPSIPNQLLITGLIYLGANVADMVVIFPLLVARIVNLHPLVVVLCVFLGSQWFGVIGMILAVPLTSVAKILLLEVHSRIYPQ